MAVALQDDSVPEEGEEALEDGIAVAGVRGLGAHAKRSATGARGPIAQLVRQGVRRDLRALRQARELLQEVLEPLREELQGLSEKWPIVMRWCGAHVGRARRLVLLGRGQAGLGLMRGELARRPAAGGALGNKYDAEPSSRDQAEVATHGPAEAMVTGPLAKAASSSLCCSMRALLHISHTITNSRLVFFPR